MRPPVLSERRFTYQMAVYYKLALEDGISLPRLRGVWDLALQIDIGYPGRTYKVLQNERIYVHARATSASALPAH